MNRVYIEKSGLARGTYSMVGLLLFPILVIFLWGMYQQLILGEPFGNQPASDDVLIGLFIGVLILCFGMVWLMSIIKAEIRLADKTISYRFPPFLNKTRSYPLADIKQWAVVKKRIWATGIGLRYDPRRSVTIYSTGTKHLLALELTSGKKIMISTRKPEELRKSLELAQTKDHE